MKATGRIVSILCILAAAALVICLMTERPTRARLDRENNALRQQLSQMNQLLAENERLSSLVAGVNATPSPSADLVGARSATDERVKELERLRGEVEVLRQRSSEIETLRADTRQALAALQNGFQKGIDNAVARYGAAGVGALQFEIVSAEYWTDSTNMDVAEELRRRVRDGSLKAIASNNLKGDPEYGQVKHLTVVYRVGGVAMTNEFREGDFVVLPKE